MKFGKTLTQSTQKEWRFYYVSYKEAKQILKSKEIENKEEAFESILSKSEDKIAKFYYDREAWAVDYFATLEKRVQELRESASEPGSPSSMSSGSSFEDLEQTMTSMSMSASSPTGIADLKDSLEKLSKNVSNGDAAYLKDAYRRMGASKHFQDYIYSKKALVTFNRELELILAFLDLNKTAFSKILKKFDKQTGSSIREERLTKIMETNSFLNGDKLRGLKAAVEGLIEDVKTLKPRLPPGWESRKVYTIGCFDLFHRGHQNVLMALREFGAFIVAGIHDDESYFKLKNKYTIDNLETRMENVKPYVDQLYVIPSTDPLLYIKSMVSDQDVQTGACCYARGDDMLAFPGREWVESVMPVHFVPRTEKCSSTLLRTIYHSDSAELRERAAFAKTRYDGKPIDENGNVLKLTA